MKRCDITRGAIYASAAGHRRMVTMIAQGRVFYLALSKTVQGKNSKLRTFADWMYRRVK